MIFIMRSDKLYKLRDFASGILLAFPIVYPSKPYYIFAFFAYLISASTIVVSREILLYVVLFIAITIFQGLNTVSNEHIEFARVMYTSFSILLFLFGFTIKEPQEVLKGFCYGITILALVVIGFFLYLRLYSKGLSLFIYPEMRLWGSEYFMDWPNFIAFGLGLGALLNLIYLRAKFFTIICIFAAVLTTSRTSLLAVLFLSLYVFFNTINSKKAKVNFVIISVIVFTFLIWKYELSSLLQLDERLLERLSKSEDRAISWNNAWNIFKDNIFTGIGPVSLGYESGIGASSIHNSYLDIAVRYGIFGFLVWLVFLIRIHFQWAFSKELYYVLGYFFLAAFFNNIFKHPHYIMLFSVLASISTVTTIRASKKI